AGDDDVLAAAVAGIEALNRKHRPEGNDRFFLFHRERRWNAKQGVFMGWERKRGKLEELNRLLRGADDTGFTVQVGDVSILPSVRYVLTLDADTRLPREAARTLIGILAHPLHRPVVDRVLRKVTTGYGILQPRVSVNMASAAGSLFARVYSGHTGVDPYTTAVSDTYQDLFGSGIFTGKGLYDVDAFQTAVGWRVPENALLSHDLFEGLYARTALVSDVELVDDYPANLLAHARRQHRWVRGDWQILAWLFPLVPTPEGLRKNRLPLVSQWKILDNLRRSLVTPALLAYFAAAWTLLPGKPLVWTLGGLAVVAFPLVASLFHLLQPRAAEEPVRVHLRGFAEDLSTAFAQALLSLVFLPFHAWVMVHAIALTLVRVGITGRRLLEWETAAAQGARAAGQLRAGVRPFFVAMAASPIAALLLLALVVAARPGTLPLALPFLLSWAVAPACAYWLSRSTAPRRSELTPEDRELLTEVARKTWRYFEVLAGADDHWLPPDNYQEDRDPKVAHRTSPTNLGLGLLATLAAHDLGWLTPEALADRLDRMLTSIESLERHEGHLLNWYDTQNLAPLLPRYVSTVDSGNLAGALLTLAEGCREVVLRSDAPEPAVAARLADVARRAAALAEGMNFAFLYDRRRQLFAIGYRLADAGGPGRADLSYYDLLASEARLASFFAIAKGDVPQSHWFHLGRLVVSVSGVPTLVSWSATMFEYLMPLLLMRSYPGTLLEQTCRKVVEKQIRYGGERQAPWGISECAYDLVDLPGNYQYKEFGVPGLGLKRGLADELVVAPYATALAALLEPAAAVRNLRRLASEGAMGPFGYYDAIDYTPRKPDESGDAVG
ncbi:MAG: carbohydrate-binding protein, partial [Thermoanaerobaculia bacterium]|nr:carbohydrate-binding protein [Thermoanaerobaculia bacterium]